MSASSLVPAYHFHSKLFSLLYILSISPLMPVLCVFCILSIPSIIPLLHYVLSETIPSFRPFLYPISAVNCVLHFTYHSVWSPYCLPPFNASCPSCLHFTYVHPFHHAHPSCPHLTFNHGIACSVFNLRVLLTCPSSSTVA